MSSAGVSNKRMRDIQRAVHIIGSVALIAYIYSPAGDVLAFERTIQLFIVPVVAITGILMWQLPRIRKALRNRSGGVSPNTSGE